MTPRKKMRNSRVRTPRITLKSKTVPPLLVLRTDAAQTLQEGNQGVLFGLALELLNSTVDGLVAEENAKSNTYFSNSTSTL